MNAALAAGAAAVFMYHHVAAAAASGPYGRALTVTPQDFEAQLRFLRARGCAAVTLDALVREARAGGPRACEVALTFDDGYRDAVSDAEPLLRRYGDRATFFITTGYIGAPGHVTGADIRKLASDGMEVSAHTVTHPDLTLIGAQAVTREVVRSRDALRAISGQSVDAFAYPAGRYDARVEAAVRAAGFSCAVSTQPGRINAAAVERDVFALPRYRVLRDRGIALMQRVLAGASAQMSDAALRAIARSRIEGNAPDVAERIAVALLNGEFPEPIVKVRVERVPPATVAGIMLLGRKFHGAVNRRSFSEDVADMIDRAFAADASVAEVDVWAVVPVAVPKDAIVSGDYAVPTNRTVFSASVVRTAWIEERGRLGATYWEPGWLQSGAR